MSEQQAVPETQLKARKVSEEKRQAALAARVERKKALKAQREVIFKRAETYAKEYLAAEQEEIRLKREARKSGDFYVPAEAKLLLVVRIKGISKIAPKPRKILQLLRLRQINNAVFVRATKATLQMLNLVTPYVTFGEPNLKTVRELIYKRGAIRINGQSIPIHSNQVIEQALGKYGIISTEDLVHEIVTVGPNFKHASNTLAVFHLSNPNGGWRSRKFIDYVSGGDAGERGTSINQLVQRM